MNNYKKIDNLLEGYSKAEAIFTNTNFLVSHIGDYMYSSKRIKIDMEFINYIDNILLSKNFSDNKRVAIINRIKSMLNSDEGITLYLKGFQFYKNILFVKNILDLMYKKIIINSDGSINITTITSTDVYLLNQILNLNIPKYLKREVINLLSTIIEVTI